MIIYALVIMTEMCLLKIIIFFKIIESATV
jgi:hypothetical protein